MDNQNEQLDGQQQNEQDPRKQETNTGMASGGNLIPDEDMAGSDADTDQQKDQSIDSEVDGAKEGGSGADDLDVDESTGGSALQTKQ